MSITVLNTNISKFTNVVHLADVHIRLTKRHTEYREVFERLFESINRTPIETLIVLAGDIVNSKLDLSPECIQLAKELFVGLANLRPTVLIIGNHDLNLSNRNRLDSLSPIVEAINHPNLFYLKKSGLYGIGNICINNYSILDSSENYIKGEYIPSVYKNKYEHFICLFHGQVDGSFTDLGFKLSNPSITLNMFNNHDLVLLGDIHLSQTLQENNGNDLPMVRYCGSLIQQNHAEPIDGHGYTLWELPSNTYTHVEIPNDYGFFTVLVEDAEIKTDLNELPKKSRLRFQIKNSSSSKIKEILTTIRSLTEVVDTSYENIESEASVVRIPAANGNVVLGDINDKNYQTILLTEYLKNKFNVTNESFINEIIKINNEVNDNIKKDDFYRNIRWTPIKFEFSNMFSYGENNIINFSKMKDLMGLFSSNTSGKSSIFSSLTFCLFDKTERENKAVNIMNIHKTEFQCKFEFEIDGKRYFIERIGKADKKGKVKVDVEFWKIENGVKIDLNGEQRKDTNETIREYLGSYEDFILTSLSVQNGKNNASIIDMGDADRKDLFSQFMGLTIFDRLYTEGNERMKSCLVSLKNYRNDDYTQQLVNMNNFLNQSELLYNSEQELFNKLGESKELVQKNILEATKKLIKLDDKIYPIETSQSQLSSIKKSMTTFKNTIEDNEKSLKIIIDDLKETELEIKKLEEKNVEMVYKKYQDCLNKKTTIVNKLEILNFDYNHHIKIYEKVNSIEYDKNCPYCVKNAQIIITESKNAEEKLELIKKDALILKSEHDEIVKEISKCFWSVNENSKLSILMKKKSVLTNEQIQYITRTNKLNQDLAKSELDNTFYERNIELYKQNIESIKSNEEINKIIEEYNKELIQLEYSYKNKSKTLMDVNSKISICKNQINEINIKVDKIKIIEQKYKFYEVYCQSVGRDGIPFDIIMATVPEIQNKVNNILCQIGTFTSLFETDGKNIIPYIVYNDKKWLMSMSSGFEKFALSLAIRVVLINISNLPKSNFLILDEGMGVMDAENLSQLPSLFNYLKSQFEFVLIISHLESLRDMVENQIEIFKDTNGFSKVNYI